MRTIITKKDLSNKKFVLAMLQEAESIDNIELKSQEFTKGPAESEGHDEDFQTTDSQSTPVEIETSSVKERKIDPDDYAARLLKYIPAEVIVLYLTLDAVLRSSEKTTEMLMWSIFLFGIIATPLYLWRIQKVRKYSQLVISTVAFFVWIFAIGGPFISLSWYDPIYGGVLLPIYTFIIPIVEA